MAVHMADEVTVESKCLLFEGRETTGLGSERVGKEGGASEREGGREGGREKSAHM